MRRKGRPGNDLPQGGSNRNDARPVQRRKGRPDSDTTFPRPGGEAKDIFASQVAPPPVESDREARELLQQLERDFGDVCNEGDMEAKDLITRVRAWLALSTPPVLGGDEGRVSWREMLHSDLGLNYLRYTAHEYTK